MFLKLFPRYAGRARRGATVAGDHLRGTAVVVENACAFYLFIRVMEITDILSQNVPLEDVQYLAGHSNPSGHTDL